MNANSDFFKKIRIISLDLFASLVPISLNNALALYAAKRAEIMNIEVNRLREANNVLNSYEYFKLNFIIIL